MGFGRDAIWRGGERGVEFSRARRRARVLGTIKAEVNQGSRSQSAIPGPAASLATGVKASVQPRREILWEPSVLALQTVANEDLEGMEGMANMIEHTLFSNTQFFNWM